MGTHRETPGGGRVRGRGAGRHHVVAPGNAVPPDELEELSSFGLGAAHETIAMGKRGRAAPVVRGDQQRRERRARCPVGDGGRVACRARRLRAPAGLGCLRTTARAASPGRANQAGPQQPDRAKPGLCTRALPGPWQAHGVRPSRSQRRSAPSGSSAPRAVSARSTSARAGGWSAKTSEAASSTWPRARPMKLGR